MGLGKVKRDVAMLFVSRCFDRYTTDNGKLAFLIPFTAYKTQTGAGFRKYLAYHSKVTKIHDLVELYPFEGAVNRTSMLVIEKGKTEFPIKSVMWSNPKSTGIPQQAELSGVSKITRQFDLGMTPIKERFPETPWMMISKKTRKAISSVVGESPYYRAYEGINTALNAVYWIDIISRQPHGLMIRNTEVGGLKKKVKELKIVLKPDLIYPLIRGRDVKRWFIESYSNYIILPVDGEGESISHDKLKVENPKVYEYFMNFFKELTTRGGEPYKTRLKAYREFSFSKAERTSPAFYWLFNVKPSLARCKVVWKRIAGGITGKAVSFASAVLEPAHDKYLDEIKPIVLNDSLILVPFDEEREAYYVSGLLNSSPVLFTIASYTYELRMETHITQYVRIPKFDKKDKLHLELSDLSKKAHKLAKKGYEKDDEFSLEDLKSVEKEIDVIAAKIYEINDEELLEIKKSLNILKGKFGEIEEELEEIEKEAPSLPVEARIKDTILPANKSVPITISIKNNIDKTIHDLDVKVYLRNKLLKRFSFSELDKKETKSIDVQLRPLKAGGQKILAVVEYEIDKKKEKFEKDLVIYAKEKEERVKVQRSWDRLIEEFKEGK